MPGNSIRGKAAEQIDPELRTRAGLSWPNRAIVALICFSTALVILETEPSIYEPNKVLFDTLEHAMLGLFIVEYVARLWVAVENPRYPASWRYAVSPVALVDLLVIGAMMFTLVGLEGVVLRLLRLIRLLRLAKLGHYSTAIQNISAAIFARRFELIMSIGIAFGLLVVSASALYIVEGDDQPEAFGSIPRSMWWATATLTTVGYGDVVPNTPLGKVFATLTAVTGIGLIAMPAGILASAFSDAIQRRRQSQEDENGV
jgi:voltage-gated potassium channel